MSERQTKKLHRMFRERVEQLATNFYSVTKQLPLKDRLAIAWKIIKKGG